MNNKTETIQKVKVRGNVVSNDTGTGLKKVCIEVISDENDIIEKFYTSDYGLFLFELENLITYKLCIRHKGYFSEYFSIPKGLRSIYFPVLLKSKKE